MLPYCTVWYTLTWTCQYRSVWNCNFVAKFFYVWMLCANLACYMSPLIKQYLIHYVNNDSTLEPVWIYLTICEEYTLRILLIKRLKKDDFATASENGCKKRNENIKIAYITDSPIHKLDEFIGKQLSFPFRIHKFVDKRWHLLAALLYKKEIVTTISCINWYYLIIQLLHFLQSRNIFYAHCRDVHFIYRFCVFFCLVFFLLLMQIEIHFVSFCLHLVIYMFG